MIYLKTIWICKIIHVNCAMNHPCPRHLSPPPPCCLGFFEILEDPIGRCKLLEQFTLAKRIYTKQQATTINKIRGVWELPLFHMKFYHPQIWPAFFSGPKTYLKKVAPKPRGRNFSRPNPTWWNKPPKSWTNPPILESMIWSLEAWRNWEMLAI